MKSQVNARLSAATRQKLNDLTTAYGTQAEALAVAVDRLHLTTFPNGQVPEPAPAINPRDIDLIKIAMSRGMDSDDLDAACERAGIDPQTATLEEIRRAVR